MRILEARIASQAHLIQQFAHPVGYLLPRQQPVMPDRLGYDLIDPHSRIERAIRVLKDHLDLLPIGALDLFVRKVAHQIAVEFNLPAVDLVKPRDHPRDGGFPRPAFADKPQNLARHDVETDAVDGRERFPAPWQEAALLHKSFGQVARFQQGRARRHLIRRPVAAQILDGEIRIVATIVDPRKPVHFLVRTRHSGNQRLGVLMGRRAQHLSRRATFDHPALIHDRHPIRRAGNDAHVMGDQDHTDISLVHKVADQLQNLRLDRHVQGGCRLVGDDHIRLGTKCQRDHHTLAHPARHLVRIVVNTGLGTGDPHIFQKLDGTAARFSLADPVMRQDRLGQLLPDAVKRMQRRQRILKDIGHPVPAFLPQRFVTGTNQVVSLKPHRATGDHTRGRGDKAHDRQRGDGFARATFADHADNLAGVHLHRHTTHRAVDALADMKLGLKVLNSQQIVGGGRNVALAIHKRGGQRAAERAGTQARIKRVAHPVTQQVDRHDNQEDHDPRHHGRMRVRKEGRARLAQHRAQIGLRWLAAQTEKAEAGGFKDHPAHGGGHGNDDHRQHIGQKFREDDPCVSHARQPGGINEFAASKAHRYAANVAGEERHVDRGHGDQCVHQAGAQGCDDRQRQQDIGKGHQHIDNAHDHVVDAPAEIARNDADGRADGGGDHRGGDTDRKRQSGAVQQAAEQIASQMVGAQQMPFAERFLEPVGGGRGIRVLQWQKRRDQHKDQDRRQHHRAHRREPVAEEELEKSTHVLILGSSRLCATSTAMLNIT